MKNIFFRTVFVVKDSGENVQLASTCRVRLPTSQLGVAKKHSFLNFQNETTAGGNVPEALRLKIHMIDLLELNLQRYQSYQRDYAQEILQALLAWLAFQSPLKKAEFLWMDFRALQKRRQEFYQTSFGQILAAGENIPELHRLKNRLISNASLLTYRVKQPFDF